MVGALPFAKGGGVVAYIEPNTEIRFLSGVPLDPDYENTLYFDSISAQTLYFTGKTVRRFTDQSYQRKTRGWLRVGWNADMYQGSVIADLYASSYMMFKNTNFENKWFYAFVDKVEYVNNNCVDVQYHIDVMQTWHFDYTLNECLIERQHVTNDTPGLHTIPEQVEHGPYVDENVSYFENGTQYVGPDYRYTAGIMLLTTFDNDGEYQYGSVVNGMYSYSPKYFTGVNANIYSLDSSSISALNETLEAITGANLADGVLCLVMVPRSLLNNDGSSKAPTTISINRGAGPANYTPRNKKLLTYPYYFLYVTNNQGNFMECKWEDFGSNTAQFNIWANYSSSPALICVPTNYYKGVNYNTDEKMTVSGFPLCSWTFDSFKAWLAQNTGTLLAGFAGGIVKGVEAIVTENPFAGAGLLMQAFNAMGEIYDHSTLPPQSKGETNGNILYQSGLLTFSFFKKHIKTEYAEIIDKYFDMYGYRINIVGVPNRAARPCYTYVKTIGCSIHGDVPSDDTIAIQNIFNKGVRFWRSTATFGNYDPTVNNNAV